MSDSKINNVSDGHKRDELTDYLNGIKEKISRSELMASTSLSTAALTNAQSAFLSSGFLDKEGNVDLSMSTPEKLEFFESSNNNINWFAKLMDSYQKGPLSPQGLDNTLSNSTDAITKALFNLHEQIVSIPLLGEYAATKDEFTISVLFGTTVILSGVTASQLPEAKGKVLESYHSTKLKLSRLMEGGAQDAKDEEIQKILTEANSEIISYANGSQQCDAMSGLITTLKLAVSTKYYAEVYQHQSKDKLSSICQSVKNYFDMKLGLDKVQENHVQLNEAQEGESQNSESSEHSKQRDMEYEGHLSDMNGGKFNSKGDDLKSYLDSLKQKVDESKKLDNLKVNHKSKDLKM